MLSLQHSRRDFLRSSVGLAGLTLPTFFELSANATHTRKAKACIIIYTWGGMSHFESFDPKPEAPVEFRGEFKPIKTATPGIQFCEHLPLLAKHSDKLAIVRSVHHKQGGHQQGMYINMTGHNPVGGIKAKSRNNWPSLASMISYFHNPAAGTPRAIRMPYSMYDNGTQMAGEGAGWLGAKLDPQFGPVVMIGDGGIYLEALKDFALLLPPFDVAAVLDALAGLRIAPLLAGVRGEAPRDLDAVARMAVRLGDTMLAWNGQVASVDINPVRVGAVGEGALALDALVERAVAPKKGVW